MASSSLNPEGQKRMRGMSLDYLKNSLLRKTSPKTVCSCNEDLGLNLDHEHTFTDLDCDPVTVELKSGLCKKCGKTIKNKSGLFTFLRKWLWWQNNLDSVNKCSVSNEAIPSDNKSKDNPQCNKSVIRPYLGISASENNLKASSDKGIDESTILNRDRGVSDCTQSCNSFLTNATRCIDNINGEVKSPNLDNGDIDNSGANNYNIESLTIIDSRIVSDALNSENLPLPTPTSRSLTCELLKLAKFGWYWGPISREEAEEKLQDQPDGAFLVRDSSASHYLLSLSFKSSGKILHARIEHSQGLFSLYNQPEQGGFATIVELIDHSVSLSRSAVFCYSRPRSPGHPAFPVRLTKPVSRFTQVRSLQYLCRFVIRQYVTIDNIDSLPLPNILKKYIEESRY